MIEIDPCCPAGRGSVSHPAAGAGSSSGPGGCGGESPPAPDADHSTAAVNKVRFHPESLKRWLSVGVVDFLEVFCGYREFTIAVYECGATVGEGIDKRVISYGKTWDLGSEDNAGGPFDANILLRDGGLSCLEGHHQ